MILLVTGMSATGKTTAIRGLRAAGCEAVDCDTDTWGGLRITVEVPDRTTPSGVERILDPGAFGALLGAPRSGPLFVSACHSNQQQFRDRMDLIVLLTAPTPVILDRLATRTGNPYGKEPAERAEVLAFIESVEPLLRRSADVVIDTDVTGPAEVVRMLQALVTR